MSSALNQKAPEFEAKCYHSGKIQNINIKEFDDYYKVLFFYPLDFSFVCPTEISELINKQSEFEKHNCKVFTINTDSVYSHEAWANQSKSAGGLENIKDLYMVSDYDKKICESYGTIDRTNKHESISSRVTYILDKDNIVKYVSANITDVGRNIDEIIRMVACINKVDTLEEGEALPCGWQPNGEPLEKTHAGVIKFLGE
tara:strand:- start:1928 stop:2527 length:600 start_codon:yes stop_codon:yes gene_type:complete